MRGGLITIFLLSIMLIAQLAQASEGVIAYRSSSGTGLNFPKIKFWNATGSGTWGSEIELPSAGSAVRWAIVKRSPASDKIVLVTQSDDSYLDGYVCMSGCNVSSNWNVSSNIGQVLAAASAQRRFDVEFESYSGDAMLVYGVVSTNTSRDLAYRVLPNSGNNFSATSEQYIDDTGHAVDLAYSWVRIDHKPTISDEMAIVAFDATVGNNDINSWIWNGTGWNNQIQISGAASATGGYEALAIRYSADGSKAMSAGGDGTAGNINSRYWNGSVWSAVITFDVDPVDTVDVQWINMKADPETDDLQIVAVDSGSDLHTAYWNGTAWNVTSNIDTTLDTNAQRCADFEWNNSNSVGRLVYDTDIGAGTLSVVDCTPRCNNTPYTITPYLGTGIWLALSRNPTTSDIVDFLSGRIELSSSTTYPIGSASFNGSGFTNYGDTIITTDQVAVAYESFSINFERADKNDTRLSVWDQNDSGYYGGNLPACMGNQTRFYANYTYRAGGSAISDGSCTINFTGSSNNGMTYNATSTVYWYNRSFATPGLFAYNVTCNKTGYGMISANHSILMTDCTPPSSTLISPANGIMTNVNTVNFTCNATDNYELKNITLYWNYTGTWQANGTVSINGTLNQTIFTRSGLNDRNISWNCLVCDNASKCAFAAANWSVTINTLLANISNVSASPSPQGFNFTVRVYATVANASSVRVGITRPGGSTETNYTMSLVSGNLYSLNYSNWINGSYSYRIYANASSGLWTNSSTYNFVLFQNLSIQVRTVEDGYTVNQTINITDPEDINNDKLMILESGFGEFGMRITEGDRIPIYAHIKDISRVERAYATIPTKKGQIEVPLALTKGTANDGIWSGEWTARQPIKGRIIVMISAVNQFNRTKTSYISSEDPPGLWILPTNDSDPTGLWTARPNARDGDTHTYSSDNSNTAGGWGSFIYFNVTSVDSDRVKVWADYGSQVNAADIDVYRNGSWVDAYQGPITNLDWFEANFTRGNVTGGRFRYNYSVAGWIYWLYEYQFYNLTVQVANPVVATRAASMVEETTAVLHSTVLSDGGDACQVRFLYGTGTSYGNSTPWIAAQYTGSNLGKRLNGLQNGVTYHFMAQINNSAGITNGSDQSFTTGPASAGWLTAMGFEDPTGEWTNENDSFDDESGSETHSTHEVNDPNGTMSFYLYLNRTPAVITDRIRFDAKAVDVDLAEIQLYNGSWFTVYNASFTDSTWTTATFNTTNVSQARIRFRAELNNRGFEWRLAEFDFYKDVLTAPANQSKLVNNGPTNASCFLTMKTQFWNGTAWLDDDTVINDTTPRTMQSSDVLKLDTIWNPKNYSTNNLSFGAGTYRVYAMCLDNASTILTNVNGSRVNASFSFIYDPLPPRVNITSPLNNSNYTLTTPVPIKANVTDMVNVTSVVANISSSIGYELVEMSFNSTSGLWEYRYLNTNYVDLYKITIIATDAFGSVNDTESVYFRVIDTTSPVVALIAPPDNQYNSTNSTINITFSCNATDNNYIQNLSLYITNPSNSSFSLNSTSYSTGSFVSASFTLPLPVGTYTWNCRASDSSGNTAFAPANRTLRIDGQPPLIWFTAPTDNSSSIVNRSFIRVNATASDPALANITINLYNSSGALIGSANTTNSSLFFNFTGLADGIYFFNATAYDLAGNRNSTATWNVTIDTIPPVIVFNNQTPQNISSTNLFGTAWNITYNITDTNWINSTTVVKYYKTNTSSSDCRETVNGSKSGCGYSNISAASNSSSTWSFNLYDNQIYPATYNFDERAMETTQKQFYQLNNTDDQIGTELLNVSNSSQYGFFEIYANSTSGNVPLWVYFCNSSYDKLQALSGSPNCYNFAVINSTQQFNHSHPQYSYHHLLPFAVNTTSGMIGTVKVTSKGFFSVRTGVNGGSWRIGYITNLTRPNATMNRVYPALYQNFNGTEDAHLHQFSNDSTVYEYVCARDLAWNYNCSRVMAEPFNQTNLPPIPPNVYNPTNGTYCGNITINYTAAFSPNGFNISYYNISLLNADLTFNKTLRSNNSQNLSYIWDTTGTTPNNYTIEVRACDSTGLCSSGFSEQFNFSGVCPPTNCPVISTPGSYIQPINYTGAPNSGYPLDNFTCVKITSSDVVFDCNGFRITDNGTMGETYGILLNGSLTNVTVKNCIVANYTNGIFAYRSNGGILTNNTVRNNSQYGLALQQCNNISVLNNSAFGNQIGFYVALSSNNSFRDNQGYNNSNAGFFFDSSPNNDIIGNGARNNSLRGFYFGTNSNNNMIISNNGSYSQNGFYVNLYSNNNTFANNSASSNIFFGFQVSLSSNSTFTDNSAFNNSFSGFNLDQSSNNNTLRGNRAYNNSQNGFNFQTSANFNTLVNNSGYDNSGSGFLTSSASNNTYINNTAFGNSMGFSVFVFSDNNTYIGNTAYRNSQYGFRIQNSNATNATNTLLYNNTAWALFIETDSTARSVFFDNITFDNPSGNTQNFTRMSITDIVENDTAYMINWTSFGGSLPADYISFEQKFVNISGLSSVESIDSISFLWTNDEATSGGYDETRFEVWKYNESGWTNAGAVLNISANTLTLNSLNPAGKYGILENNVSNCPVITSSGSYNQSQNFIGAPNNALPLSNFTCVKIAASNVAYDCNGFNITDNGTAGMTYGILLNGSITNVTVRNCPGISNYSFGIYLHNTSSSKIINNSVFNNSNSSIVIGQNSANNLVANNSVFNSGQNGIQLISGSMGNNISTNNVSFNGVYGITMEGSNWNRIIGNTVNNNSEYGIVGNTANDNVIDGNLAFGNLRGIHLGVASANNSMNNNTLFGGMAGIFIGANGTSNNATNNRISNNSLMGIALYLDSRLNLVRGNTILNSTDGVYISSSANNTIENNSITLNSVRGIFATGSSNNTVRGNNITNNTFGGVILEPGSDNNAFTSNRICFNDNNDMNNSGASNGGTLDRCDYFSNWNEFSQIGCTFTCSDIWHNFYGNVSGKLYLGHNRSQVLYSWTWNGTSGKIFAYNGNAQISWANVTAIGRNASGTNSTNDFTTLDTLLNTTAMSDSITALFGVDGSVPRNPSNETIYGRNVPYVPMTNSSTFTSYKTGIMWDSSGDTNGHFDSADNENIVFVSTINRTQAFNYNMKIPANISYYKGTSGVTQFWIEMD